MRTVFAANRPSAEKQSRASPYRAADREKNTLNVERRRATLDAA